MWLRAISAFPLALAAFGCEESTGPGPPRDVTIVEDTLRLSIGDTTLLTVTVRTTDGELIDTATVDWISNDPTVATVDEGGNVAAIGLGAAVIVAVSEGYADSAAVVTGLAFTVIAAGDSHTCGLVPGGAIYCWGDGRVGQLGHGMVTGSSAPVRVVSGVRFTSVTAGAGHTCALAEGGTPFCWGDGGVGQLGTGTPDATAFPTPVTTGATFTAVSAGYTHTCGITDGGRVYCWGSNLSGQLGTGGFIGRFVPDSAATPDRFLDVRPGRDHTCAVSVDGQAYCWGRNDDSQLGLGNSSAPVPIPTALPTALTFRTIEAGDGTYSCGIWLGRRVYCWGRGDDGQLGTGTSVETMPNQWVDPDIPFQTIAGGTTHVCGTTTAFETYCWGTSRLGVPGATQSPVPLSVPITLTAIAAGAFHTCGLSGTPGRAYCWGGNNWGQLGTGSVAPSDVPELVLLQIRP